MNDLASFITENLHNENVEIAYVNKSDDNKATKL